jgi:hypothetical protein
MINHFFKLVIIVLPIEEAGQEFQASSIDRHKYISVKKTLRRGRSKDEDSCYVEHETMDINVLLSKNNDDKFKEMVNVGRVLYLKKSLDQFHFHCHLEFPHHLIVL